MQFLIIGSTLLKQIQRQAAFLKEKRKLEIRVVGLANSKKMIFDENGVNLTDWKAQLLDSQAFTMPTFIAEIKKYIEKNILAEAVQIDANTNLKQAGIDSFSTVEIILFIERKFGVSIPDEKLIPDNFKTLEALAATVEELMPNAP